MQNSLTNSNKTEPRDSPHNKKKTVYPCFTGRTKLVFSWSITRNSEDRGFNWERSGYAYLTTKLNHRSSFTHPPWNFFNVDFLFLGGVLKLKFLAICNLLTQRILASLVAVDSLRNFQKLLSYMFYRENVARVVVHFFFTAAHFYLALVAASISHFVTPATKFSCCSSNKKMSPWFLIPRSRLCPPLSRWASLACHLLSLFLCLSQLLLYIPNLWTRQFI